MLCDAQPGRERCPSCCVAMLTGNLACRSTEVPINTHALLCTCSELNTASNFSDSSFTCFSGQP